MCERRFSALTTFVKMTFQNHHTMVPAGGVMDVIELVVVVLLYPKRKLNLAINDIPACIHVPVCVVGGWVFVCV